MDINDFHTLSITKVCGTIDALLQVPPHPGAAKPLEEVLTAASEKFAGEPCSRVLMYNPDAIGAALESRAPAVFRRLREDTDIRLPMLSVTPPVTPVCFASMYAGVRPAVHGIQSYRKPVLKVPTVFDDLAAAGRKAAIVSTAGDSISRIFLRRPVDYFILPTVQAVNDKALDLIAGDAYDLLVVYNGNYDYWMHRNSPTGPLAMRALRKNQETFAILQAQARRSWQGHNAVLAFAPDHGSHRVFGCFGNHGEDEPWDMNIFHFWSFQPRKSKPFT